MNHVHDGKQTQAELWNDAAGRGWVAAQDLVDQVLGPFDDVLLDALDPAPGASALDVGCGTGGTTLALARRLGPSGRCVGVDVAEPMIAAARARAERAGSPATFVRADAQTHAFEPASFDVVCSRFGVMFFDDPVRAFANLRGAAAPGAALCFVAWRGAADNPFMTTAERAAAPLLPHLPAREPDAPGQFAFADARRVRTILDQSGWDAIEVQPLDVPCSLPEPALVPYLTRLGPVGRALQRADDRLQARVVETVRPAFDPYVEGAEVRFTAACWLVRARRCGSTSRR